jgi:hypothetical protein|tara:strand:+ start:677 stop:856 length:180 start_codon:yes stop_codon:yes gene_type:complete
MPIPTPPNLQPKVESVLGSAAGPAVVNVLKTIVGTPFRIADSVKNGLFDTVNAALREVK